MIFRWLFPLCICLIDVRVIKISFWKVVLWSGFNGEVVVTIGMISRNPERTLNVSSLTVGAVKETMPLSGILTDETLKVWIVVERRVISCECNLNEKKFGKQVWGEEKCNTRCTHSVISHPLDLWMPPRQSIMHNSVSGGKVFRALGG